MEKLKTVQEKLASALIANNWVDVAICLEANVGLNFSFRNDAPTTPLIHAIEINNMYWVNKFLEKGADVNYCATNENNEQFVSPLMVAVHSDYMEMAEFLIGKGAEVDTTIHYHYHCTFNPLLDAVESDIPKMVEIILSARPNVEVKNYVGNTPLMHAIVEHKNAKIVEMLLAAGANPLSLNKQKMSPLMILLDRNDMKMFRLLLACAKTVDTQHLHDGTLLLKATEYDNVEAVDLLLKRGANRKAKDTRGITPQWIAKYESTKEIRDVYRKHINRKKQLSFQV